MKAWEHVKHITDYEKSLIGRFMKINPAEVQGPPIGVLICAVKPDKVQPVLLPLSKNSTGGKLLKTSRLPVGIFLGRLERRAMFDGEWNNDEAYHQAKRMVMAMEPGKRVVLIGQRVAVAFGFTTYFVQGEFGGSQYVTIPEPKEIANERNPGFLDGSCAALQWAADHLIGTKN